jgi:hypothetical protein
LGPGQPQDFRIGTPPCPGVDVIKLFSLVNFFGE